MIHQPNRATPPLTDADLRRFYGRVRINRSSGCPLTWDRPRSGGYGALWVTTPGARGRVIQAHRIAASLAGLGVEGVVVRHDCDNPACVTPDHLRTGTQAENIADRAQRGRTARMHGETNGNAVLTSARVCRIREMRSLGASQRAIAEHVGASRTTIRRVLAGHTWAHVPTEARSV